MKLIPNAHVKREGQSGGFMKSDGEALGKTDGGLGEK